MAITQPDPRDIAHPARQQWALPEDDRLLMSVLFVGSDGLPDEDLDVLARRRGVSREEVRGEVLARAERRNAREAELRRERAGLAERRYDQAMRVAELEAIIGSEGDDPDARPEQGVMLSDYVTRRQLKKATPGERAALLARRLEFLRSNDQALEKIDGHLRDPGLKDPVYEEVAIIIGRVSADDFREVRSTAANWVNKRLERIRKALTEMRAANRGRQS